MESAESFFSPGGNLSRVHPFFEDRPGQRQMAVAVEQTLRRGGALMVEAGTGTGKTLAYLVPALACDRRVVISTGTRNLQDQVFTQEIPFLRDRVGANVSACLMKGRENYLCRHRFAEFVKEPLLDVAEEAALLPEIERWSRDTPTGDRAEIAGLPDRLRLWRDINARADTCGGSRCPEWERCWLTRMKKTAQHSQIVVVNHHLFFADLAVRTAYGAVIPDYDTVIFDEAHLLEEVASLYFGVQVSSGQVEDIARDAEVVAARAGGPGAAAASLREAAGRFFAPLRGRLRLEPGRVRFDPPEEGGPALDAECSALAEALSEIGAVAARAGADGDAAETLGRRAQELREDLLRLHARRDPEFVFGMESRGRGNVVLSATPIDVSGFLRETLFDELHACVLTSATLAVEGRFDFFRERLGLDAAETLVVESPFDTREQAVLYLPRDMPEPREPGFLDRAVQEIRALLEITEGRGFLLFTSYANMERVRGALDDVGPWELIVQGEGSKVALVESFKTTPRAVLLGTTSFWHGVDVPGEALSLVVVDKLPFDVPSDPLVAARIDRIREQGGNPFASYQTPLAVLELKQGLGRLLRSRGDRGILAVLDPRLRSRSYGRVFLRSLPGYRIVRDLEPCRRFFRARSA